MIATGGGRFDPAERPIYFLAVDIGRLTDAVTKHPYILIALNALKVDGNVDVLKDWLNGGARVLLDSGIFDLAVRWAKENDVTVNEAFGVDPETMNGFDVLMDRYVRAVSRYESDLWGYIELDIGGHERKTRIRSNLEMRGFRPIPVYHPLNDPPEYFDTLAMNYDRIAVGNMATADRTTRMRLLATVWDRHQQYPDLWVHVLGVRPSDWLYAFPCESVDASSFLSGIRWPTGPIDVACGRAFSELPVNFRYRLGHMTDQDFTQHGANKIGSKSAEMGAYMATVELLNWRHYCQSIGK